jgi:hypothetical protein
MIVATWPWLALILLGAWHGLNPGMGWLFSVALGLQQRSRRAVFLALLPIAVGHALAIGLVVLLVYLVGIVIPSRWLQIGGAGILFAIAIWKLWRARHPTWVGMRVNFWDLTTWSWLMAPRMEPGSWSCLCFSEVDRCFVEQFHPAQPRCSSFSP